MADLKRKMFDDFDIPETPTAAVEVITEPKKKKTTTKEHRSIPLNYRNYLGAAYKVFEQELSLIHI